MIERWNGKGWRRQTAATPPGANESDLQAISCPSATTCTAVGWFFTSQAGQLTLAERWQSGRWLVESTPELSGLSDLELSAVSCPTIAVCEAVGIAGTDDPSNPTAPIAERWNGSSWDTQSVPTPNNGTDTVFVGVSCHSANLCTAVGDYVQATSGARLSFAERWNGSSWKLQKIPTARGSQFSSVEQVSCPSTNRCVAVGYSQPRTGSDRTFAAVWNGSTWAVAVTPDPRGGAGVFLSVSCTSPRSCTGVGQNFQPGSIENLAERWNGYKWVLQSPVDPTAGTSASLLGASCPTSSECLASGSVNYGFESGVALVERWS